jgi:hypothetical protein
MKSILVPLDRYNALVKRVTGSTTGEEGVEDRLSEELILLSIPKTFRGKASALLAHLRDVLKWNVRGELLQEGQVVLASNITDLLKDLYRREYAGPAPSGAAVFWEILKKANAPLSLILNEDRKLHLQALQSVQDVSSHAQLERASSPHLLDTAAYDQMTNPMTPNVKLSMFSKPLETPNPEPLRPLSLPMKSQRRPPRWMPY